MCTGPLKWTFTPGSGHLPGTLQYHEYSNKLYSLELNIGEWALFHEGMVSLFPRSYPQEEKRVW